MFRFQGIAGPALTPAHVSWLEATKLNSTAALGSARFAAAPVFIGAGEVEAVGRDGTLLVVASARLDGLEALRHALGNLSPADPASGITAHIAAAWRRWGSECPQHLFGDYAFVLHDHATGETFCARDHIGAQTFYYSLKGDQLAFADSIEPLLSCPGVSADFDESYVATALLRRDFEPRRTFYRDINKLPAGHSLHIAKTGAKIDRWWRPEDIAVDHTISDADAVAETSRLLQQAVSDRLEGHERVGIHLSGGLDSSLVAALASQALRRDGRPEPTYYCWQDLSGPEAPDNEIGWAQAMARELDTQLVNPRFTPAELADLLMADWTKGPDAKNLVHEAPIQRHAQDRGITLILSGWGGDEAFSSNGRGMVLHLLLTARWFTLCRVIAQGDFRSIPHQLYHATRRLMRDWFRPRKSPEQLMAQRKSLISPAFAARTPLLSPPRYRPFGVQATQIALLRHGSPTERIENWAMSGAASGLVYGYPLLDRRLLEWVLRLPPRMFNQYGQERWLAREVSRGLLPDLVRDNVRKDEPFRVERIDSELGQALALIAARLDNPVTPVNRCEYIDMAKLHAELVEVVAGGSGLGRGKRTAIQFLEFP